MIRSIKLRVEGSPHRRLLETGVTDIFPVRMGLGAESSKLSLGPRAWDVLEKNSIDSPGTAAELSEMGISFFPSQRK